jgi:hypothetical protein
MMVLAKLDNSLLQQ